MLGSLVEENSLGGVVAAAVNNLVKLLSLQTLVGRYKLVELVNVGTVVAIIVDPQLVGAKQRRDALVVGVVEGRQVESPLVLNVLLSTASILVNTEERVAEVLNCVARVTTGNTARVVHLIVEVKLAEVDVSLGLADNQAITGLGCLGDHDGG